MLRKQLQAQRGCRPKIEQDSYAEWRCPRRLALRLRYWTPQPAINRRERLLDVIRVIIKMRGESQDAPARRDDDPGFVETFGQDPHVHVGEPGGDDRGARAVVRGRQDFGVPFAQPLDKEIGERLVPGEDPPDVQPQQVIDRAGETRRAPVGHGAELETVGVRGELQSIGTQIPHPLMGSESDEPRLEAFVKMGREIHHGDAEGPAQPLVGCGNQRVDPERPDVDRDPAGRLRCVDDEQGSVPVRGFSEPRHVESLAGAVNHIGDADDGGPGIDQADQIVGPMIIALHVGESDFGSRVARDARPRVDRAGKLETGADDVAAGSRRDGPGEGRQQLGRARSDRDLLGTAAEQPRGRRVQCRERPLLSGLVEMDRPVLREIVHPFDHRPLRAAVHEADRGGVEIDTLPARGKIVRCDDWGQVGQCSVASDGVVLSENSIRPFLADCLHKAHVQLSVASCC